MSPSPSDGAAHGLQCDVCIIGTGPAGSTLARELSGGPLRVIVLESGGTERQPEVDALNEIENVGWPRRLDQWSVRNRIVGGTSHTWWGRCSPFDPIDFEAREWVADSGWPFGREEVEQFLRRAEEYLGLEPDPNPAEDDIGGGEEESFGLAPLSWRYSRDPDRPREPMRFGPRLAAQLGPNVRLLTSSTAVAVRTRPDAAAVESVEFADAAGQRFRASAGTVILCAGGIENARLLLASRLGNDLVGRFLMDHPRGVVGTFDAGTASPLLARFGWTRKGSALRMRGLRLTPGVQRDEQLLNCASWPEAVLAPDDPVAALRRVAGRGKGRSADLVTVTRNAPFLARNAWRGLRSRGPVEHRYSEVTLKAMCEQRPDRDSRVVLADRRDRLGTPLSRIDWHVSADEARTLGRTAELVASYLEHLGIRPPVLEDWVRDGAMPPQSFTDIAHPTGTTRMARSASAGVVDENCAVHGVGGLYVAGSSVFPTAGHANPTLMIVALAVRLADHLRASVHAAGAESGSAPVASAVSTGAGQPARRPPVPARIRPGGHQH